MGLKQFKPLLTEEMDTLPTSQQSFIAEIASQWGLFDVKHWLVQ